MQKKEKMKYRAAGILASVLIPLITACVTKSKTEYLYTVPEVDFPLFPDPEPVVLDEETETVSMPLWYWQRIAEYKIDVDAIENYLNELKCVQTKR